MTVWLLLPVSRVAHLKVGSGLNGFGGEHQVTIIKHVEDSACHSACSCATLLYPPYVDVVTH